MCSVIQCPVMSSVISDARQFLRQRHKNSIHPTLQEPEELAVGLLPGVVRSLFLSGPTQSTGSRVAQAANLRVEDSRRFPQLTRSRSKKDGSQPTTQWALDCCKAPWQPLMPGMSTSAVKSAVKSWGMCNCSECQCHNVHHNVIQTNSIY